MAAIIAVHVASASRSDVTAVSNAIIVRRRPPPL